MRTSSSSGAGAGAALPPMPARSGGGAASSQSSFSSSSSLSLVDTIFQRSLDDLIKALRSNPAGGDPALISRSLDEIRREIRSGDPDTKSSALRKLTYLSSLHGADMSFASFNVLELLPSSSLSHKRAAYLAASLSFRPSTGVLLLATNQLRKDLSPSSPLPVSSLAVEFLSVAATPELASDLAPDVHALLSHPKPSIRPKAAAAALRIFALFPDAVRASLKRLVEALDPAAGDPRLLSAVVGVFCELCASDPRPYLPLAPEFYKVLLESRDNWVLIKVLKIFSMLAPLEPRLARRLLDPVCDHMQRSNARSLVCECVRTAAVVLAEFDSAVRLAADKAKEFVAAEDDANLRYLGLKALSLLAPRHSWAVAESREAVVKSLSDPDPNLHREALRLVIGMVDENNAVDVSDMLVGHALKVDPEFCNEILGAVLDACGRNFYELVMDFDWYVSLMGKMARNPHCTKGEEIERHLVDVGMRVRDARPELVRVARGLLIDPALLGNPELHRILSAAAWLSGEYVEFSRNPIELVEALLQPRTDLLPASVRVVYVQAVWKVASFSFESEDVKIDGEEPVFNQESLMAMLNLIESAMDPLIECDEVEVQERARSVVGFVRMLRDIRSRDTDEINDEECYRSSVKMVELIRSVFTEELGPVPTNGQTRVPIPDGLVLVENLADLSTIMCRDEGVMSSSPKPFSLRSHQQDEAGEESIHSTESNSLLAEHRKRHGLYYLPSGKEDTESNDYPRANELIQDVASSDLVNAVGSSPSKTKVKSMKPRPVVVKLDEGYAPGLKEDPSPSRKKLADKSQRKLQGEDNQTSPGEEERKEVDRRNSSTSSKLLGKNKPREQEESSAKVLPPSPVVQDLLL